MRKKLKKVKKNNYEDDFIDIFQNYSVISKPESGRIRKKKLLAW